MNWTNLIFNDTGIKTYCYTQEEILNQCITFQNNQISHQLPIIINLFLIFWGVYNIIKLMSGEIKINLYFCIMLLFSVISIIFPIAYLFI